MNVAAIGQRAAEAASTAAADIIGGTRETFAAGNITSEWNVTRTIAPVVHHVRSRRRLLVEVTTSCNAVNVVGNELISLGNNIAYSYAAYFAKYTVCRFEAVANGGVCSRSFPKKDASRPVDGWGGPAPFIVLGTPPSPVENVTIDFSIDASAAAIGEAQSKVRVMNSRWGKFPWISGDSVGASGGRGHPHCPLCPLKAPQLSSLLRTTP